MTSTNQFNPKNYLADKDAPIVLLKAKPYFEELTEKQKKYSHYVSKACHWGSRAVLRSVSPESESIFDLIIAIHKKVDGDYDQLVIEKTILKNYLQYASQFVSNLGNYKSFGDAKFIPNITQVEFDSLVKSVSDPQIIQLYESIRDQIYEIDEKKGLLGWPEDGHVSAYYLNSVTKSEIDAITQALNQNNIRPENTRNEKVSEGQFIVRVASAEKSNKTYYPNTINFKINGKEAQLTFKFGDHSKEFVEIVQNLKQAAKYAENDIQSKMINHYISSFETGSVEDHVQSQIEWVKDIGPQVETNIGFIETYRAPDGTKGEWEGFVAMVNKDRTLKFQSLVNNAKKLISLLPWDKEFEKDVFQAPDFTSLEVLTFAGSGIPLGINIPNYDTVRINNGFKNVSLGNVLNSKVANQKANFISDDLQSKCEKYSADAFEVQVGIHELLGHGTGKLLMETGPNEFNFDINSPPKGLDGKPVTTFYKHNETWSSLFGSIAGSFEECRAESVAMYLITNRELLGIFGFHEKKVQNDIIFITFLKMATAGLLALEFWDPKTGKWGQPHMQARFAILMVMLQANESFVQLEFNKSDFSDLVIKVDESQIETVGHNTIGEFLRKLHVYKCSGDAVNGTRFYNDITTVGPEIAKFRNIVLSKRLPRKQFIQANTYTDGDTIRLKEYEASEVGMIQSFVDRDI